MQDRLLSDGIAVYVYRQVRSIAFRRPSSSRTLKTKDRTPDTPKIEFLQLLRSPTTGEFQASWNHWYARGSSIEAPLEDKYGGLAVEPVRMEEIGVGGSSITKAEFEQERISESVLNCCQ